MDPRRARIAIALVFAVHGTVSGTFAARLLSIREELGVGTGQLGIALMGQAFGAFVAMTMAGRLIHRFGERGALRLSMLAWTMVLPLPALMPNIYTFAAAMFVMGAAAGTSTVTTNAQAVVVEHAYGRSIMTGLHGMWSVGNLTGAGIGALAVLIGLDVRLHFVLLSLTAVTLAQLACATLPAAAAPVPGAAPPPPRFGVPTKAIVAIGLVGFCSSFVEGASHNWTAIYIEQITGSTAAVAAFGYAAFVAAMAVSRLLGDQVVRRIGPALTVRTGASLAALGALTVALANHPAVGIAGFMMIGTGAAVTIPLAAAAGGRLGATPAQGVAGVMSITFTAGLIAPAAIGGIADLTSMRVSFAMVAMAAVTMAVLSKALGRRRIPEVVKAA
ncbi:MFS transporter [Phytomonospora sp. NPDC050363]|uniref:MFS transporter n=1 Tax=Phytomonospora sp. NPDC050363 TaxID=3155642 RepID=UPI0033D6C7F2